MTRSFLGFCLLFVLVPGLNAQIKIGDQPTQQQKSVALDVKGGNQNQGLWLPRVSDTSITGIRSLNPPDGLLIYHTPSGKMLLRTNNAWVTYNTNTSNIASVTAGAQTVTGPALTLQTGTSAGTGNDFNIVANNAANTVTYNLPNASATVRGAVNTTAQTFGGAKTFQNGITVNNGSTLNNGTTANGGVAITGNAGSTSNLTLGVTASTTPAATTDKYLSVDAEGKVTLNSVNVIANNTLRIKTYTRELDNMPNSLNAGNSFVYTFTIPGANLSTSSTVSVSPLSSLDTSTKINWARVVNATTIEMSVSAGTTKQNFTPGNSSTFNITVIEF